MDEYITKEQVIDWFSPYGHLDKPIPFETLVSDLRVMKSADVAPVRHGRWIEYTKVIIPEPYNKWEQAWKCSECGFDDGFVAYNYCPNCGAKMDGGADNE